MKRSGLFLIFLLMFVTNLKAQHGHPSAPEEKPVALLARLGETSYPVVTTRAEAEGKQREAELVRREFERAWKNADVKLKVEDL